MSDKRLKLNRQTRQKFDRINRLSQVQNMDPIEFEQYVGYLYQKDGYQVAMTVTSGDEGVDLFLRRGLSTAVVQCKRYAGTVGQPTVRDLYGAMVHNRARRAILVTSGAISQPAEEWAKGKPIDLVDGHELMSWAKRSRGFRPARLRVVGTWVVVLVVLVAVVGVLWGQMENLRQLLPTAVTPNPPILTGDPQPVHVFALQQGIVSRQIKVDGGLSEWNGISQYPSAYLSEEAVGWDGSDDLGATWQLAWNSNHLLVAVVVTDDVVMPMLADGKELGGDYLQLLLATETAVNTDLHENSYQITLLPGDLEQILPSARLAQGKTGEFMPIAGPGIQVAVRPMADGYTLEAAIPWRTLGTTAAAGAEMRVVLRAMDSDEGETAVPQVTYTHLPHYEPMNPNSWGELVLDAP